MAKANTADAAETNEPSDAPLIDLNDASIKKLFARAKKRGYLTYDELNAALPPDQMSSDQLEDVMSAINEMGINIVEKEEAGEVGEQDKSDDDEDEADDAGDGTPAHRRSTQAERKNRTTPNSGQDVLLRQSGGQQENP